MTSFPAPTATLTPTSTTTTYTPSTATTGSTSTWQAPPHASFPPFYTLQPNQQTRARQLAIWSTLLLSHASSSSPPNYTVTLSSSQFSNPALKRSLPPQDRREVLSFMVRNGHAAWTSNPTPSNSNDAAPQLSEGDTTYLWHRSPEEYGNAMVAWADDRGLKGTVLTMFEILEGDGTNGECFHGLPVEMARVCLRGLQKAGKANLFGGTGGQGEGVKFF